MSSAFQAYADDVRGRAFPPQPQDPSTGSAEGPDASSPQQSPSYAFDMPPEEMEAWAQLEAECLEARALQTQEADSRAGPALGRLSQSGATGGRGTRRFSTLVGTAQLS